MKLLRIETFLIVKDKILATHFGSGRHDIHIYTGLGCVLLM